MKYFKECKYIWQHYVPKSGQADTLQGELLRQIEKLRYEAQDNGNINWDENFEFFCEFLKETLCGGGCLDEQESAAVTQALERIKAAGQVALRYNCGEISDEELEQKYHGGLAYTEDDLYDVVNDAVAVFYLHHKEPIPYEKREEVYR